jgi:ketosteroid isomerase-like protein
MPNVIAEVTTEVLQAFADAWNRHDVDALMSFMTEDCVFEACDLFTFRDGKIALKNSYRKNRPQDS